ncbi:MAG: hypothetical protein JWQ19_2613 [Subtercola sp.]|nr:hypothetical protein [Subtercola sp.]
MTRHPTLGVAHADSAAGHHPRPTALLATIGMSCAHHIREAAPHLLTVLHRASTAAEPAAPESAPVIPGGMVSAYEWETGRWFVISKDLGMLGEIERTACCYLVSHSTDARGAAVGFRTLQSATEYFNEYAAALSL